MRYLYSMGQQVKDVQKQLTRYVSNMLPIVSYSYCVYKNQSITFLSACQVLALSSLSAAVPAAWLASTPGYAASMCADCSTVHKYSTVRCHPCSYFCCQVHPNSSFVLGWFKHYYFDDDSLFLEPPHPTWSPSNLATKQPVEVKQSPYFNLANLSQAPASA